MSVGGGAMVHGNTLSSNKGYPRRQKFVYGNRRHLELSKRVPRCVQNTKKALVMVDKGKMESDTIEMVDWARLSAFQDSNQKINH